MGFVIRPNYSGSNYHGRNGPGLLRAMAAAFAEFVRRHGAKGIAAMVVAAVFAFAPLTLLYWFNELRLSSLVNLQPGQTVIVKPARHQDDQEREEPGETALLQVICESPSFDVPRPLLVDDDPRRNRDGFESSSYVRREMVYLRPAGIDPAPPFALLGKPPISVWVPAGDYEIIVVHEAPRSEPRVDAPSRGFPYLSVFAECSLEKRRKTVCRVLLPHYDSGFGAPVEFKGSDTSSTERMPTTTELSPLLKECEAVTAVPTPGGYLLALAEPVVHHADEHHGCTIDFAKLQAVPREWTQEQLATLRNWLPDDAAAARARLSSLVDALSWREFFQGWFCYAAAGVAGLVFTRWGTLAMVEPWRRGESFKDSLGLLVHIFLFSAGAWFLFHVLTDSSGCSGPVPFRIR